MANSPHQPLKFTASRLSVELRKDRRTLARILANVTPCGKESGYDVFWMADVINAMLAEVARAKPNATDGLAQERAGEAKERRLKLARENAIANSQYVNIDDVGRSYENRLTNVRTRLMELPGKCAPLLEGVTSGEAEELIAEEIESALKELSGRHGLHA